VDKKGFYIHRQAKGVDLFDQRGVAKKKFGSRLFARIQQ
jgi:hypothetical protein